MPHNKRKTRDEEGEEKQDCWEMLGSDGREVWTRRAM
jgi:hypothetical protein